MYEILSMIGQGGFGIVYKGKHRELGIDIAIKEYFPSDLSVRRDGTVQPRTQEFQDPFEEGLERFLREAKQLERFRDCPNIVTCRDLFRANGTAYMIMDYVPGLSLSKLLEYRESRGEPLTEEELLNLILPLLTGLQKVHDADICHRDIKPSNILVRRDDSAPILIDFGAAKHDISKRTKSIAPYTDGYAAMEQIGEGEIGPWTDMYGLGAVIWRMVAGGNPPFSPPNPPTVQKRAFEMMQGQPDPLPSAKEIGKGRFDSKLLQAIDDCLIVNLKDRIQDGNQLTERIKSDKANTSVSGNVIKLPEALEKEKKNFPRRKFWKGLGVVIVSIIVLIIPLVLYVGIGLVLPESEGTLFSISIIVLLVLIGLGSGWLAGKMCQKMMPNHVTPRYVLIGWSVLLGILLGGVLALIWPLSIARGGGLLNKHTWRRWGILVRNKHR